MKMKDKKKAEETAEMRMQMIAPLLVPNLGYSDITKLNNDISAGYEVSVRTLERYCKNYVEHGFEGLFPQGKNGTVKYKIRHMARPVPSRPRMPRSKFSLHMTP